MEDQFGGAKPKTRTPERTGVVSRGNNLCNVNNTFNSEIPCETETSFSFPRVKRDRPSVEKCNGIGASSYWSKGGNSNNTNLPMCNGTVSKLSKGNNSSNENPSKCNGAVSDWSKGGNFISNKHCVNLDDHIDNPEESDICITQINDWSNDSARQSVTDIEPELGAIESSCTACEKSNANFNVNGSYLTSGISRTENGNEVIGFCINCSCPLTEDCKNILCSDKCDSIRSDCGLKDTSTDRFENRNKLFENQCNESVYKGARPKVTKSGDVDISLVQPERWKQKGGSEIPNQYLITNSYDTSNIPTWMQLENSKKPAARSEDTRTVLDNGVVNGTIDGPEVSKRLSNSVKLSKQKQQEYQSAKERWKRSGFALRKYIAEKLGFSQEKSKVASGRDDSRCKNLTRVMANSAEKPAKSKQERSFSMDTINSGDQSFEMKENVDVSIAQNEMTDSRSKLSSRSSSKDREVIPRSRSFLRYLGLKKEKNSSKEGNNRLKVSKSFDMSSSEAWPESSTDTGISAASDWSADNTLTNGKKDNTLLTNKNAQNKQTAVPFSRKCVKGSKTENIEENRHKSRKHKKTHKSKSSKDIRKKKKENPDERAEKESAKDHSRKWVGVFDEALDDALDEDYEFVLEPEHGEIVRRVKEKKHPMKNKDSDCDSNQRNSKEISDSTVEAMLGLNHAVRYLPENFRNRLSAVQNSVKSSSEREATPDSSHSSGQREANLSHTNDQKERTANTSNVEAQNDKVNIKPPETKFNLPGNLGRRKREHRNVNKKSRKNKDNWRNDRSNDSLNERDSFMFDSVEDYERNLDSHLEDPFHVRSSDLELCSGLMNLVKDIDIPFIDDDVEAKFDDFYSDSRSKDSSDATFKHSSDALFKNSSDDLFKSSNDDMFKNSNDALFKNSISPDINSSQRPTFSDFSLDFHGDYARRDTNNQRDSVNLFNEPIRYNSVKVDSKLDDLNQKSFIEDPEYPGLRHLNDSFDRLLGDDETDSSSDSSALHHFLQRSRSNGSISRSKSSDDSVEADDEFECECDHCQLLRQHYYGTNNLDLVPPPLPPREHNYVNSNLDLLPTPPVPPRTYVDTLEFSSDLDLPSFAPENIGFHYYRDEFGNFLYLGDEDVYISERHGEHLIFDDRPLSIMLEDVIQQMLNVQPELLNEQAAPPAPTAVIENLPTLTLTTIHIEQHPSCPICLCPSEIEEIMTLLPCQHVFHPICIEAWLIKSGTCPVCRGKISS